MPLVISIHESNLIPAFYTAPRKTVCYAESLEAFHKNEYKDIPTEKFGEEHGFTWTEDFLISEACYRETWEASNNKDMRAHPLVEERLHQPLSNLVIVKINDEVNHGIFFANDAKECIPAGTVLGIYAGEVSAESQRFRYYVWELSSQQNASATINQKFKKPVVDAGDYGNITRFMQDLPNAEHPIKDDTLDIARANVTCTPMIYYGMPIICLLAARDIKPGEQLGYEYGYDYWRTSGIQRCVFNKAGAVVDRLKNSEASPSSKATTALKESTSNRVDHVQRFILNIHCAIKRLKTLMPREKWVANFDEKFNAMKNKDAGEVCNLIKYEFVEKSYGTQLAFQKELLYHLEQYTNVENANYKPQHNWSKTYKNKTTDPNHFLRSLAFNLFALSNRNSYHNPSNTLSKDDVYWESNKM